MNQKLLEQGFTRQRRSLFIISLVFSIALYFEIQGSSVKLGPGQGVGLTVDLGSAAIVYWGMLLLWLWFMYRYYVYYNGLKRAARTEIDKFIELDAAKYFKPKYKKKAKNILLETLVEDYPQASEFEFTQFETKNPVLNRTHHRMSFRLDWHAKMTKKDGGIVKVSGDNTEEMPITGRPYYIGMCIVLTRVHWRENYLSEYFVVWWLAMLPLAITFLDRERVLYLFGYY